MFRQTRTVSIAYVDVFVKAFLSVTGMKESLVLLALTIRMGKDNRSPVRGLPQPRESLQSDVPYVEMTSRHLALLPISQDAGREINLPD